MNKSCFNEESFQRRKKNLAKKKMVAWGVFKFHEVDIKLFSLIMQFQINSFYKWNKVKTTSLINSEKSFTL